MPLLGRKLPTRPKNGKHGKKRQTLKSYNTAQVVQYGKIRVKYHKAYYANTPYHPSLTLTHTHTQTPTRTRTIPEGADWGNVQICALFAL